MPFVVPPARIEVGGVSDGQNTPLVLRGGVYPLQFFPSLAGRRVDVGAGYRIEKGRRGSEWQREGPYAEVGMYPFQHILGSSYRLRGGALAVGEYFLLDDRGDRAALSASAAFELVGITEHLLETADSTGFAFGEWGFGAFAGPGLRFSDSGERWAGTFGVSLRIPFMLGVYCCIDPLGGHEDEAEVQRNERSASRR